MAAENGKSRKREQPTLWKLYQLHSLQQLLICQLSSFTTQPLISADSKSTKTRPMTLFGLYPQGILEWGHFPSMQQQQAQKTKYQPQCLKNLDCMTIRNIFNALGSAFYPSRSNLDVNCQQFRWQRGFKDNWYSEPKQIT